MTKLWENEDPLPTLWQQREQLKPLCHHYGARVVGGPLAQQYALAASRTACHKLAALLTALTDFQEWYDYADFYVSFDMEEPAVTASGSYEGLTSRKHGRDTGRENIIRFIDLLRWPSYGI